MLTEQQQQARDLYLQSDLNKSEIASLLNISRRTLHYWIRQNNWDRLKESSEHMPSLVAENCYFIISRLTHNILNQRRNSEPVTFKEAETLHKLALTIGKLKKYATPNENMETFGRLIDQVREKSPKLAAELSPFIDEFILKQANAYISDYKKDNMSFQCLYPEAPSAEEAKKLETEVREDTDDNDYWESGIDYTDQSTYHRGCDPAGFNIDENGIVHDAAPPAK